MEEVKDMSLVEITTHLVTPLTKEEKKFLPEKIRMALDSIVGKRRAKSLGMWNMEGAINTQVCQKRGQMEGV